MEPHPTYTHLPTCTYLPTYLSTPTHPPTYLLVPTYPPTYLPTCTYLPTYLPTPTHPPSLPHSLTHPPTYLTYLPNLFTFLDIHCSLTYLTPGSNYVHSYHLLGYVKYKEKQRHAWTTRGKGPEKRNKSIFPVSLYSKIFN